MSTLFYPDLFKLKNHCRFEQILALPVQHSMLKRSLAITAIFTALFIHLQKRRKNDLILHGQLRLATAILTAITDRLLFLPFRRIHRYLCLLTNLGLPQPGYLTDLTDQKGAAFITNVLRSHFNTKQIKVKTISVTPFSAGQMSLTGRIDLTYSASTVGIPPPSLIVKMTRQDIKGKALNMLVGLYRECECYSNLLPSTGCPVPDLLFSSVNNFSKDFLLILSDGSYLGPKTGYVKATTVGALSLADTITTDALKAPGATLEVYHTPPSMTKHGSWTNINTVDIVVDMMKKSVIELSKMHIKYWRDESLFEMDLSLGNRNSLAEAYAAIQSSWNATKIQARSGKYEGTSPWRGTKNMSQYESLVSRTLMAHLIRWGQVEHNDPTAWSRIDDKSYRKTCVCEIGGGFTLLHGDFHSENVFVRDLPPNSKASKFLILDWQMPSIGDPVKDVARMPIFGGLDNLGRAKHEESILKTWWETFTDVEKGGISKKEYPWECAWISYKYWAAHHAALLIMSCEISKFFLEDDAAGYRMAVDKFNAVVEAHGDPTVNFEKRAKALEALGRSVEV